MIISSRVLAGATAVAALGAAGMAQAFTVPGFTAPGVSSPGYPDMWGANIEANLTQGKGKNAPFTLSVTGTESACNSGRTIANCSAAIFNFPGGAYLLGSETLNVTATFSANGAFQSGTYTITGSLPASSSPTFGSAPTGVSWSAQSNETLLTATLNSDSVDSTDEALGFKATITGGWADQKQFTGKTGAGTVESVWLYSLLVDSDNGWSSNGSSKTSTAWNTFLAELKSGSSLKANTFYGIASVATVPLPAAVWLFGSGLMGLGGVLRRRRKGAAAEAQA